MQANLVPLLQMCYVADLEWKIIYVGSAESEEYDQTLDSVLVGPVPAGRHMFVFQVSVYVPIEQGCNSSSGATCSLFDLKWAEPVTYRHIEHYCSILESLC